MSALRGLALAGAAVACAAPPGPSTPATPSTRLERAARVERVRFHGVADPALAGRARALLEERVAAAAGGEAARPLSLELQLARVEVARRLRAASVATLGLAAWLGDGAWRVESRLSGRLRARDARGCRVAEVQAQRDYRGRAGLGDPAPLPGEPELRALVDRLVALADRRLRVAGVASGSPAGMPCRRRAARGILTASRPP